MTAMLGGFSEKETDVEDKKALLEVIEGVANLLTGMQFDPAIPSHAKDAMRTKAAELELVIERTQAELWGY